MNSTCSSFARAAALIFACTACVSVDVIPRYGMLDVEGDIGINDASSGISAQNDVETMGLEEDDSVLGARVDVGLPVGHLTFQYSDSTHDGSGRLQADVSDGTTTIPAGTNVDSDFDLVLGEGVITWDLVPTDLVEVGLGFGATLLDLDASVTSQVNGDEVSTDEMVPLPVIAARVGLDLGRFDVSVLAGGMAIDIDDVDAAFFDVDLMARYNFFDGRPRGGIVVGYRHVEIDAEYEDDGSAVDADVQLTGPYIGIDIGL